MCKCNIKKCKSECCYSVAHSISFLTKHQSKIVNTFSQGVSLNENSSRIIPITTIIDGTADTTKQKCPFLNKDYSCNVYEDRPQICRCFGTTKSRTNLLTCFYHLGEDYHTIDFSEEDDARFITTLKNTHPELLKELMEE